jgi:hypothetical protein
MQAFIREDLKRRVASGEIRPAPAWMIEEDKLLRARVRALFRSSTRYMAGRTRVAPSDVVYFLELTTSYGLTEALDIIESVHGGCVPIELAGKIDELITATGMYFARHSRRAAEKRDEIGPPGGNAA